MGGQFLPGYDFAAQAEVEDDDGSHHVVPSFAEIGAAGVNHYAELATVGLGGEDIADQLVGGVAIVDAGEEFAVEYFAEVAVAFDYRRGGGLKIGFGEFGLDQEVSYFHVYFGAISFAVGEWNSGFYSELRGGCVVNSQQAEKPGPGRGSGKAENIHEESVGTVAGIQFTPFAAGSGESFAGAGMDFLQALAPVFVFANGAVGLGEKISMVTAIFGREITDGWGLALACETGKTGALSVLQIAEAEFVAEVHGERWGAESEIGGGHWRQDTTVDGQKVKPLRNSGSVLSVDPKGYKAHIFYWVELLLGVMARLKARPDTTLRKAC